jgi:hypothetical protein
MRLVRNALLLLVLLSACLKDKVPVPPPPEVNVPILHQTFTSPESFTCVDTIIQHPSGCGMIVQPADSAVSRTIDLDADGQADFEISCTSWYQFQSASYPCVNYNVSFVISALQNNGAIATVGNFNEVRKYAENDSIQITDQWHAFAAMLLDVALAPFFTDFNGTNFFGLKIRKNNEDWYGWLKLNKDGYNLTLLASGVKQGPSTGIKAGQIQ